MTSLLRRLHFPPKLLASRYYGWGVCGLVIFIGLAVRLWLAPSPGFEFDVGVNQGWGRSAVELGLAQSYVEQVNDNMLPNYAPFSIMLFASMGWIQKLAFGGFEENPLSYLILIKLPAIIAEVLMIPFLFFLVRRWKGLLAGSIVALIFALHPAALHDTALWGQTDSIFSAFLMAALGMVALNRFILAGALCALALLTKMQAVMLLPFFFILFVRGGWRTLLDGMLGGLLVTVPILAPFAIGGTLDTVVKVYIGSVGFYSIVSSAAYNFWWSLYGDEAGNIDDTIKLFGLLSYRNIGLLMFGCSYAYALIALWKHLRPSPADLRTLGGLSVAAAFICFSFFLWNTQMHERYLFPFIMVGLPMVFLDKRAALLYGGISFFFYLNLLGWLHASEFDHALYEEFPTLDVFVGSAQTILWFVFAHYIFTYARRTSGMFTKSKRWRASMIASPS